MRRLRKSHRLYLAALALYSLIALTCNGTEPSQTEIIVEERECYGDLYVEKATVARVTPQPKETYEVAQIYTWEPPYGIEVTDNGLGTLQVFSAQNILQSKFDVYMAETTNGQIQVEKWNGTKEIVFRAGNFYVQDNGGQELCNVDLFALGVGITSVGTEYVITVRPEIDEVTVAVLDGAVNVTNRVKTVTLDAQVPDAQLVVVSNGIIGPLLPVPDPEGLLEDVINGGDIVPEAEKPPQPVEPFRVGFITDTGGIDNPIVETQWNGIQRAVEELGVEAQIIQLDVSPTYLPDLSEFGSQGYDLVIASGISLGDDLAELAAQNPDIKFTIVDSNYPDPSSVPEGVVGHSECIPNVQGQIFKTDQAAFLAGYLAAGMTQTGWLGYFGGLKIPAVTIFGVGFQQGIEYYNEVHGTSIGLLGWDNVSGEGMFIGNFFDIEMGMEITRSLFDEGVDIFIPVAGSAGTQGFVVASQYGGYGIWVDVDGYNQLPEARDVLLTSVMKNMDNSVYDVIEATMNGNFNGCGVYIGDLVNNGVGIAPYHDLEDQIPDELKAEMQELRQQIISGEITDTGCISYPEYCPPGLYETP